MNEHGGVDDDFPVRGEQHQARPVSGHRCLIVTPVQVELVGELKSDLVVLRSSNRRTNLTHSSKQGW